MKKNISLWNAVITHVLTTAFTGFLLLMVAVFAVGFAAVKLQDSPFIALIFFITVGLMVGAIALATWLSVKFMRRYEIAEVANFVNYSSIIMFVLLLWRTSIIISIVGVIAFYFITKKAFPVKAAPAAAEAPTTVA